MKHVASRGGRTKSALWTILGILAELMLTAAAICALYIAWQMWWTGVQSEHNQIETRQSVSWSDPGKSGNVTVAKAQQGDPPVQPQSATEGELIAQIYVPQFGSQWQRNLVEGTDLTQLNKHGLGHYTDSQMPGQVGNFAFAGHRNGYGQPLGDVDKLQEGDPIIVRTQDYWYVYHYTSYKIVLPTQTEVVAANPENPGATPTKRMLTMTTCEPKYSTPTHRWISYAEFSYWAKVADGIPQELASQNANGTVKFVNNEQSSFLSSIDTLKPWIFGALAAYGMILKKSKFTAVIGVLLMLSFIIPGQTLLIPQYRMEAQVGLVDSLLGLIVLYTGGATFCYFLIVQYMRGLPYEIIEAARIDGAGPFRIFWTIVLPLIRPILTTVIVFQTMGTWNDFMTPSVYISSTNKQTIVLQVFNAISTFTTNWPLFMTVTTIALIPVFVFFIFCQRWIVAGLVAGSVKG